MIPLKRKFKKIFIYGIVLLNQFHSSCGLSEKEEIKLREDKEKMEAFRSKRKLDSLNVIELIKRTNAYTGFDTLNYYSFYLQRVLSDSIKNFCFNGEIVDIEFRDSIFYLKMDVNEGNPEFDLIAEIKTNKEDFKIIENAISKEERYLYGTFILKVSDIKPISSIVSSRGDEENLYLEESNRNRLLYIKGDFVDCYIPPRKRNKRQIK